MDGVIERVNRLEDQIVALYRLVNSEFSQDSVQKEVDNNEMPKVIGTQASDFVIMNSTIMCISDELKQRLLKLFDKRKYFTGKINICFPGCEKIGAIFVSAFRSKLFKYASGIDLSKMRSLMIIENHAFENVGCLQSNFEEINLNTEGLQTINFGAFQNVGKVAKNFCSITFGHNLRRINCRAFKNVAFSCQKKVSKRIIMSFENCKDLYYIGKEAFANYKRFYQYDELVYNFKGCNQLKVINEKAFEHTLGEECMPGNFVRVIVDKDTKLKPRNNSFGKGYNFEYQDSDTTTYTTDKVGDCGI